MQVFSVKFAHISRNFPSKSVCTPDAALVSSTSGDLEAYNVQQTNMFPNQNGPSKNPLIKDTRPSVQICQINNLKRLTNDLKIDIWNCVTFVIDNFGSLLY